MAASRIGVAPRSFSARTLAALAAVTLAACGGGGGGSSGGGSITPQNFTSWGALPTNTPVVANGMSVSLTAGGSASSNTAASSASVLYNARTSAGLRGFTFTAPSTNATWTTSSGSSLSCSGGVCALANAAQTTLGAYSDPYSGLNAWDYQSFGAWSLPNGTVNAMSFGAPTAFSALPTSLTATYSGELIGRYKAVATDVMDGSTLLTGGQFGLRADVTASVVISGGTREITFSSTGSRLEAPAFPEFNDARFDIAAATLTISGAANSFTGAITSGSGNNAVSLSGTANGRFYGPAAEELGGTILLQGTGGRAVVGGFGGKR